MINMQNAKLWRLGKYAGLVLIVGTAMVGAIMLVMKATPKNINEIGKTTTQVVQSVTAEVRPITSVLVLEASVVANPMFRMTAPIEGTLVKLSDGSIGIETAKNKTVQPIELPPSSKIVNLLVPSGTTVTAGLPVLNAKYLGFVLQATVAPEKIYRLYNGIVSARGEIMNGPGPFASPILGTPFVSGAGGNTEVTENSGGNKPNTSQGGQFQVIDSTQGVVVVAAAPSDLRLLEGSRGLLALTVAEVPNAVVLPVEAVAGISQRGQVYVDDRGKRVLRDVVLGITDGSYIQITSGLSAGEKIILPSPSITNLK